jgi:hypothetical protein
MSDKASELDATPLANQLLDKTRGGKIKWESTADENTFLATVGGSTFRVFLERVEDVNLSGQPEYIDVPAIALLSEKGKSVWTITSSDVKGGLHALYEEVRRVGHHLDERLAAALAALEKL